MTDEAPKRPSTALDSFIAPPMSEEERQQLARTEREQDAEKWVKDRLSEISYMAIGNKDIARALCKSAAHCAYGDTELTGFIKSILKKSCGRPKNSLPKNLLLMHYAHAMIESKHNHILARKSLNEYVSRMRGYVLSDESMENLITKAINEVRQRQILLGDLHDWIQPIIQERMDRGTKTGKHKAKENKP